jgi:hypothetical protein
LTSGCAEDAVDVRDENTAAQFIQKPYAFDTLSVTLQKILGDASAEIEDDTDNTEADNGENDDDAQT